MKNYTYSFNLLYLAVIILWPIIQYSYFEGIDGAGRVGWLMMLFAVVINGRFLFRTPGALIIWSIWIVYNIINSLILGFKHESTPYSIWLPNVLVLPFITMLVAYRTFSQNYYKTLKFTLGYFSLYVILGLINMEVHSRSEFGIEVSRSANELGNAFVNSSIILLTLAFFCFYEKIINKVWLLGIITIEVTAILLSGSRKGLISVFFILFLSFIGNIGKKHYISYIFVAIVAYGILQFVLANSVAGARIEEGYINSNYSDNFFLSFMGDRGWMYYYGWEIFLKHPLFGIGLYNFYWINPLNLPLPIHSEYMVQLCECGVFGTLIYLLFISGIVKRAIHLLRDSRYKRFGFILFATIVGILFLNLFTWTYANRWLFFFYGFLCAYYNRCQINK